jgi:phosphatidylglycerophosphatase A
MKKLVVALANGLGTGLSPFASGTTGSLLGIPLALLVLRCPDLVGQAVTCLALTLLAIPICSVAEKHYGKKDDGRIVADEYLTFPICMIGLPASPVVLGIAFVVNRICDIIKPPPARGLQRVKGGLGIVIDDFFACLYALGINHAIVWFLRRQGFGT